MKYMGSKSRISKNILPYIFFNSKDKQFYVEPFVGGGNMIESVKVTNRVGYDINKYVIGYLCAIRDGWLPPKNISRDEYIDIRDNKDDFPDELVAYCGFAISWRAIWFISYFGTSHKAGINNARKQSKKIQGCEFIQSNYSDIKFTGESIIYCDPPYIDTKGYGVEFSHTEFYTWVRNRCLDGHDVFISELSAPDDFIPIWGTQIKNNYNGKTMSEQIFVHESQYTEKYNTRF